MLFSFVRRHKWVLIGTLVFISAIVLMGQPVTPGSLFERPREVMLDFFSPVQDFVTFLAQSVHSVWDRYLALRDMKEENQDLRRLVGELSAKYDNLKTLYIETDKKNKRLEDILGFVEESSYELIPARVIGRDASIVAGAIIIDRGFSDGIKQNMPVITPRGVVGLVLTVSKNSSRVMLISDKNSSIDVILQENRTMGILEGSVDGTINLIYVDRKVPVKTGEVLVTAGLGGIFPKGLLVGEVSEVKKYASDMFARITVRPTADLGSLEEVLIIVK
jgi:rod shape-determining protein MreC